MSFEGVSKDWAAKKIRDRRIAVDEVISVYFEVNHPSGCWGHSDGDYCYCETTAKLYATVRYKRKGSNETFCEIIDYLDFESILRELVEWNAPRKKN